MELPSEFKRAIAIMERRGPPLFISGPAGSGKSKLLTLYQEQPHLVKPVLLAPTGIAALNIGGMTIHRFFNFSIAVSRESIRQQKKGPRQPKIYKLLKTLIIDEVSMLRADLLDCIDTFLQLYGPEPGVYFGGVRLILAGDLFQLPPVLTKDIASVFQRGMYETPYFFSAHAIKSQKLDLFELKTIYRQNDPDFINMLNRVRRNRMLDTDFAMINRQCGASFDNGAITLTTTNKKADTINQQSLQRLDGEAVALPACIEGELQSEDIPTDKTLTLKRGAQVMMVNNDPQRRWINGVIGHVEKICLDQITEPYILIRLEGERQRLVTVTQHRWDVYRFFLDQNKLSSQIVGSFTQFPLRLAWAITIHKSQGKTYNHVIIDFDKDTFASGQAYVALSRCRSLEGIRLLSPLKRKHILSDAALEHFFHTRGL